MGADSLIAILAPYGLQGLVIAALSYALWRKDGELSAERAARIADAKASTSMMMEIQQQVIAAVNKLSDFLEAFEEREEARKEEQMRLEREAAFNPRRTRP